MGTAVVLAIGIFICQARSQICGPNLLSSFLGLENGPYGPGLQLGPLAAPPCGQPVPVPSCGIQAPPYGIAPGSCGIPPPCGMQVPPCGRQVPPCGIQTPPCGIPVPPCGIQAPIINNIPPVLIPNQPCVGSFGPIVPYAGCDFGPNVVTVVDNTLANSLANALQLLIVSNLLESSLTIPCSNSLPYSPVYETNPYCGNIIEILSPDYPCNQQCDPVYEIISPYLDGSCSQDPIMSYAPCAEINSYNPVYGPDFVNPYANYGCSDNYGLINFPNTVGCPDNFGLVNPYANSFLGSDCGLINPYANSFSCSDCGLINPYANSFSCSDCGIVNPYANSFGCSDCGLINPYANSFGCMDSIFSPVAAEVLFPAEIPAQLTCNFGYMPNNVPCVSVNVEPLPFDACSCDAVLY